MKSANREPEEMWEWINVNAHRVPENGRSKFANLKEQEVLDFWFSQNKPLKTWLVLNYLP